MSSPKKGIIETALKIALCENSPSPKGNYTFDMSTVKLDGDMNHYAGHLDTIAYHAGVALGNKNNSKHKELVSAFREVSSMAGGQGHDWHEMGHTGITTKGSRDIKYYKDTRHIDKRDRTDAFNETGGEQHTAKKRNRANLLRFGNRPGPFALGHAQALLQQ